ncbi:5'-methylthioadenosine/S-adenosylhomocysteine nucleosidase family protein [Amycolatopsis thermoflava]|uniref:5'-methylthioadenosine/S-adenosylhomocysteine nucleosidase family protein n=1 Tax=Amycolatopsis thermoflava TaxID=84480 RepID=UPI00366299CB
MTDALVVVLTALNSEYAAVRQRIVNPKSHRHERGTLFEVGTIAGSRYRAALALTGKGNHSAAVLAERAIDEFAPVAVLFVGVAGALWDTPLGDIVVATHVYAYHGGTSEDDGLKARPRVWEIDHGVYQLAARVARERSWLDSAAAVDAVPEVHFGPIAAGEVVHNSRRSAEAAWVRRNYNDAMAIEMEAAGVAQAGHLSGSPVAIVRGISDRADGTKTTGDDRVWQPRAARNAAAFAMRLAEELIRERELAVRDRKNENRDHNEGAGNPAPSVTNIAFGQVGIQTGALTGSNVWVATTPQPAPQADLVGELRRFRKELRQQRDSGTIPAEVYEEAQRALDSADDAAEERTPDRAERVVHALGRVRRAVSEVGELAAKVTALIAAVKGVS